MASAGSGSDGTGSMRSATNRILPRTRTTRISNRSSMAVPSTRRTGRTRRSAVASGLYPAGWTGGSVELQASGERRRNPKQVSIAQNLGGGGMRCAVRPYACFSFSLRSSAYGEHFSMGSIISWIKAPLIVLCSRNSASMRALRILIAARTCGQ